LGLGHKGFGGKKCLHGIFCNFRALGKKGLWHFWSNTVYSVTLGRCPKRLCGRGKNGFREPFWSQTVKSCLSGNSGLLRGAAGVARGPLAMPSAMSSIWPQAKLDIAVDIATSLGKIKHKMCNGGLHVLLQVICLFFLKKAGYVNGYVKLCSGAKCLT
jgi:hypothetical protein